MVKMLDFWAQWCAPCRLMSPIVDELAKEYNVEKVDVDTEEGNELAKQYNIKGIPTFIFLKDDMEVDRIVGSVSKESLTKLLGEVLNEI